MSIQEILLFIESFKGNTVAGVIVILYYLIVYWPKIRDGLGLSLGKPLDYDRIEKNYQLLKLRIEIEKLKKESGLNESTLSTLEAEMLSRQEIKKGKAFTQTQKFVAVPLLILTVILVIMGIQSPDTNSTENTLSTISGGLLIATITVVGFWGIPHLQQANKSVLRFVAFAAFWAISFYVIAYLIFSAVEFTLTGKTTVSDALQGYTFLTTTIVSIIMGKKEKLPFMAKPPSSNV